MGYLYKFSLVVLVAVLATNPARSQNSLAEKIAAYMTKAHHLGLFNGNILVADHGKILCKEALGFTDSSQTTQLTTQYRFEIGSIAKEFNAVGIMMLVDQGKLGLGDKVSKYLPQLPQWANTVTIKNLLQYRSGLPDINWNTVKTDKDAMDNLLKLQKLDFETGSNYEYNNNNVFLQRRIIEKVTGISFKKFVEQKILKPCHMSNSLIDPTENDSSIARGYDINLKGDKLAVPISGWTAVTLEDFYKWNQAIADYKLISPAATKEILIPANPGQQSGLGGGTMENGLITSHIHDGTAYNYQALIVSNPQKGRTVIIMTNNKNFDLYKFNTAIQAILEEKPYLQAKQSILKKFHNKVDSLKGTDIISFYKTLKISSNDSYAFEDESTLNEIGYYLLANNRIADAITVFEYNTVLFPKSWNAYDSLGEAYYHQGDKQKTIINYRKSLEINPDNQNAKNILTKLE